MDNQVLKFDESQHDIEKIKKENKNVVIDFTADWCGPCKQLGPKLEEYAKSGKFLLVKINVDDNRNISEQFAISGIPHVILFVEGVEKYKFTGFNTKSLEEMINLL
jgi:thioredoxin